MKKFINLYDNRIVVFIFFIISLFIYINTLQNNFVYDDDILVHQNRLLRDNKALLKAFNPRFNKMENRPYRPVREFSYYIDYQIWKINPLGYHFTNIIIHAVNVSLFFFLINFIFNNRILSLFSALLFLAHPVNTEAVAWISGRKELLSSLFVLLSSILFLKHASAEKLRKYFFYGGSVFAFLLAVLSKESGLALIFMLVIYDLFFLQRQVSGSAINKIRIAYLPFFFITLLLLFMFVKIKGGGIIEENYHGGSFYSTIITMPGVIIHYIGLLLMPLNLKVEYAFPVSKSILELRVLISISILLALLIVSFFFMKRKTKAPVSFGILWFFAGLIPVANIIPVTNIIAERYLYFSAMGFCVIAGFFFSYLVKRRKSLGLSIFIIIITIYSARTFIRNRDWKDNLTLWSKAVEQTPDSARARINLGNEYLKRAMHEEAIRHYREFLKISHDEIDVYINLGISVSKQGYYELGEECFLNALKINPDDAKAHINLGNIYFIKKELEKAEKTYLKAIELRGATVEVFFNLGNLYMYRFNSLWDIDKIRNFRNKSMEVIDRSKYLKQLVRYTNKAVYYYKKAISRNPEYIKALGGMADIYRKKAELELELGYQESSEFPGYEYNVRQFLGKAEEYERKIQEIMSEK